MHVATPFELPCLLNLLDEKINDLLPVTLDIFVRLLVLQLSA